MIDLAVDLTTALGAALAPAPERRLMAAKQAAPAPPPVFQMAALPEIVDPALYADAHSNTNPNGSFLSLRRLRDLVDPVPLFSTTYQTGTESTEKVWGRLLLGASSTTAYANGVLTDARQNFAGAALPGSDGSPGVWRPVYAPSGWTNLTDDTAFRKVTVDLTGSGTGPTTTKLAIIGGGDATLQWTTVDSSGETTTTPISSGTSLDSITLDIRQVTFQRPWLDYGVITTAGIGIDGQDSGFVSSGDISDNDGQLPLLPTAFWLARSARLSGTIAPADKQVLAEAGDDTHVTLGGIAIAGPAADAPSAGTPVTGQVVAWTSTLVPYWPK